MPRAINNTEKLGRIFLVLFVVSTVVILLLMLFSPIVGNIFAAINSSLSTDPPVIPPSQSSDGMGLTVLVGSVITSVTSLVGFITTTMITWRKEKREDSLAEVQRKKLETELEKSKIELEELKKSKTKKRKK